MQGLQTGLGKIAPHVNRTRLFLARTLAVGLRMEVAEPVSLALAGVGSSDLGTGCSSHRSPGDQTFSAWSIGQRQHTGRTACALG